jgi:hypothetical protein
MDFKSLLNSLDQLSEATEKTKTGIKHTAEPGGYGRKDDEDDEGNKVKPVSTEKKGRGRPKKATSTSGEDKKYDFSAFGVKSGKDIKLPKYDKKKTTKHSIKEYIEQLERSLNEAEQIQIKPASQMAKKPGQTSVPGQPQQVAGQPQKNTQVIQQGDKVLGSVDNPQLANQIKQSIGKGEMTLMPDQQVNELSPGTIQSAAAKRDAQQPGQMSQATQRKDPMVHSTNRINMNNRPLEEKDIGKHNNATTGFDALVKKLTPKYGVEAAKRIAGAQLKKIKEADQPPHDALASPLTLEAKKAKPDFLDMDKDGDKKEPMKGAVKDKKKVEEGMNTRLKAARHAGKAHALGKQGYNCTYDDMEESKHYHEGYKEGLDECYGQMPIQGYVGEVEGTMPAATVPGMASQEQHGGMDEGNAFTAALKRTPTGGKFSVGGKTFKDTSSLEESPFAFESLEQQLSALLESKEEVAEGMTVSISKGQQGAPDSVSVSAQDGEADQLLSLIKSAGLGLFGGEETNGYGAPQGEQPQHGGLDVVGDHDGMMALIKKVTGGEAGNGDYADEVGPEEHGHEGHEETCEACGMTEASCGCDHGDKEVVDEVESEDQMTYQMAEDNPPDSGEAEEATEIADTAQANQAAAEYNPSNDIDEGAGGPEASEEPVEELTPDEEAQSDEEGEEAKKDKEDMSESMFVNLYKKLTLISEESTAEKDDKAEKAAKKVAKDIEYDEDHKGKDDDKAEEAGKKVKKDIEYDDKKDKLDEWANNAGQKGTDTSFETDIDFMMNVISGGLNKRKSTGQTTIPVIASQLGRQVARKTTDINESVGNSSDAVAQWKKLAGLK